MVFVGGGGGFLFVFGFFARVISGCCCFVLPSAPSPPFFSEGRGGVNGGFLYLRQNGVDCTG